MSRRSEFTRFRPEGFRARLLLAMMLVTTVITALVLYVSERNLATQAEQDLQRQFRDDLATLRDAQALRQAALVERCRALVRRPRLHAALEDGALDLLYPSARDELRDIMAVEPGSVAEPRPYALHARFYRFLDRTGVLISPGTTVDAGALPPAAEARLALSRVPTQPQTGYLAVAGDDGTETMAEIIAMPIISSETGEVIAVLVLGFNPVPPDRTPTGTAARRGVWLDGRLLLPDLVPAERAALEGRLASALAAEGRAEGGLAGVVGDIPHQLYYTRLNLGSLYPPAYEVCLYPLAGLIAQQRHLRWQILGLGGLLLLGGLGASHLLDRKSVV